MFVCCDKRMFPRSVDSIAYSPESPTPFFFPVDSVLIPEATSVELNMWVSCWLLSRITVA